MTLMRKIISLLILDLSVIILKVVDEEDYLRVNQQEKKEMHLVHIIKRVKR